MRMRMLLSTLLRVSNKMTFAWEAFHRGGAQKVTIDGMEIHAPDDMNFLVPVIYEIYVQKCYTKHFSIGPEDQVVDIGANVGVFSLFASQRTNRTVFGFEPVPHWAQAARANAIRNDADVEILPYGAGGIEGVMRLGKIHNRVETKLCAFPEWMDKEDIRINFLKMDCEGGEGSIFANLSPEHFQRIDRIAMEYHDDHSELNHVEIETLLGNNGYQVTVEVGNGCIGQIYAHRD